MPPRLPAYLRDQLIEDLREIHGDNCWLCGTRITFGSSSPALGCASLDHIIPVSKGGRDHLLNLRLSHRACNGARGNSTDPDEIAYRISELFAAGVPITAKQRRILEKKREIGRNALPRPRIDENQFEDSAPEPDRFARLDIHDGRIHFSLYRQDGTMQPMECPDTLDNRTYIDWMQAHDRYTGAGTHPPTL